MKHFYKLSAFALCLIMVFCIVLTSASADNGNVTYSGNSGQFIFSPGSSYSPTDLFPNFKDVMPGDTISQLITVKNKADNHVKVNIYMRSKGATDERFVDFLNQLRLTVKPVGSTPLFVSTADQVDGLADWTCIGTLYSGGSMDLVATLEVPTTMEDRFQKNIGLLSWEFAVEEIPVTPVDPTPTPVPTSPVNPRPPKTGDEFELLPWTALFVLGAAGVFVVSQRLIRHKKKKRVEQ